jgi:hypothetical protein
MWTPRLVGRGAIALAIATGVQLGTACSGENQHPTAAVAANKGALNDKAPSPRATAIRARAADVRHRSLTTDEQTRVASLKGKWQWVADLHHAAMQEAIHDPSLHGLRQPHTDAERCAVTVRYMAKYSPAAEGRVGQMYRSASERTTAMQAIATRSGLCPSSPAQASLFVPSSPRPQLGSPANDSVISVVHDYVAAMGADIGGAKDLADANAIMDAYLATASSDPSVSPLSLALIAGTVDLGASSALEWDTYGRTHQASLFMWDWLSDLGNWIGDVVMADVGGCETGFSDSIAGFLQWGYTGDTTALLETEAASCGVYGIGFSIGAAM